MPQAARTIASQDTQRQEYRTETQAWYQSRKWRKATKQHKKLHPYCVHCRPVLTIGNIVDHITPHHGDLDLFWDPDNWQTLCRRHHNIKTRHEQGS